MDATHLHGYNPRISDNLVGVRGLFEFQGDGANKRYELMKWNFTASKFNHYRYVWKVGIEATDKLDKGIFKVLDIGIR